MPATGIAAALATVVIWAGFLVSLRFAITTQYSQGAMLLMRFLPAAVVLAPVIWRTGLLPKGVPLWQVLLIILGSGVPFYYLISLGISYAHASDVGVLAPGSLPLIVALVSFAVLGERFTRLRVIGFALILTGGLIIGLWEVLMASEAGAWRGHLLIITAIFGWAFYTVAFRMSGMSALDGAALSIGWSVLLVIPVAMVIGVSTGDASWAQIGVITLIQGVLAGAGALVTFGLAVRLLGASRTAAFTALTPIVVMVASVALLGEPITGVKVAGILIVSTGVFFASGVLEAGK
ncbi:MAG: DMT family transporter [Pseudomonadota bacterium]